MVVRHRKENDSMHGKTLQTQSPFVVTVDMAIDGPFEAVGCCEDYVIGGGTFNQLAVDPASVLVQFGVAWFDRSRSNGRRLPHTPNFAKLTVDWCGGLHCFAHWQIPPEGNF